MPISLADLLLRLAEEGLIEPFWSQDVLDGALRAVIEHRPDLDPARLTRRFAAMSSAFEDAMIDTEGADMSNYWSPDPEDQWVMAAAHRSPAGTIITRNLAHFPASTLANHAMTAQTADSLLLHLFAANPAQVISVFHDMRKQMQNPPLPVEDMLANLAAAGVPSFAEAMRTSLAETH